MPQSLGSYASLAFTPIPFWQDSNELRLNRSDEDQLIAQVAKDGDDFMDWSPTLNKSDEDQLIAQVAKDGDGFMDCSPTLSSP